MIRCCEQYEIDKLLPMARAFFADAGEVGEFHDDKFVAYWHGIYHNGIGAVWVDEQGGEFKAMLGITVTQEPHSGLWAMTEHFLYSVGGHAGLLARKAIKLAEGMKVARVYMHHQAAAHEVAMGRLYRKLKLAPKFVRCVRDMEV